MLIDEPLDNVHRKGRYCTQQVTLNQPLSVVVDQLRQCQLNITRVLQDLQTAYRLEVLKFMSIRYCSPIGYMYDIHCMYY